MFPSINVDVANCWFGDNLTASIVMKPTHDMNVVGVNELVVRWTMRASGDGVYHGCEVHHPHEHREQHRPSGEFWATVHLAPSCRYELNCLGARSITPHSYAPPPGNALFQPTEKFSPRWLEI